MATNPYDKYSQEFVGLERQRETAKRLREQSELPLKGEMVGGHYVAPNALNSIASLLRGYTGMELESKADKGIQDVQNRRTAERDAWLGQMPTAKQETLPEGVEGPTRDFKPKTEDYLQWATKGMAFDPATAQMGMSYANLNEGREQRKAELSAKLLDARIARQDKIDAQRELAQMQQEGRIDIARLAASLRPAPAEKTATMLDPATGQAILMPQSQALQSGMQPYNAQSVKSHQTQQGIKSANVPIQAALDQAALVYNHPGKSSGTGWTSFMQAVPATDAKAFGANLNTFKAQSFLGAVETMRGLGALTEQEGKKLVDSVGALDASQKTEDFDEGMKQAAKFIYDKAKAKGIDVNLPDFANSGSSSRGSTQGKQGGSIFNVDQSKIDAEIKRRNGG